MGDKSSKYFQNFLKVRYKRNSVVDLDTSRGKVEQVGDIKLEAFSFFKKRFFENKYCRPNLNGV